MGSARERMDWAGYLTIFGAILLLIAWSTIISYLVLKYRARGRQGRCRPVTPPRVDQHTSRELSQITGGLLTTEENVTRDSLDSSSTSHLPQLQLERSSHGKL